MRLNNHFYELNKLDLFLEPQNYIAKNHTCISNSKIYAYITKFYNKYFPTTYSLLFFFI